MSLIFHLVDRNAKRVGVSLACRTRLDSADRFTSEPKLVTCAKCKRAKLTPEEDELGVQSERLSLERHSRGMQWCSRHKCEHPVEEFTSERANYCRQFMREYNAIAHGRRTAYQRRRLYGSAS